MPSNIPSYLYSLLASLLIGTILVTTVSVEALAIRNEAKTQQLKNVEQYVAAQALSLLSQTTLEGQSTTQYIEIPSAIGNERFWIQLTNNTQSAWVESGFGLNITSTDMTIDLPAKVTVSGSFISGSGRPLLQCHFENQIATLTLTQE
jgi:hypothetical protein